MAVESTIFRQKSPHNCQTLTHSIPLIADFTHFEQPFFATKLKNNLFCVIQELLHCINFEVHLPEVSLNQ